MVKSFVRKQALAKMGLCSIIIIDAYDVGCEGRASLITITIFFALSKKQEIPVKKKLYMLTFVSLLGLFLKKSVDPYGKNTNRNSAKKATNNC